MDHTLNDEDKALWLATIGEDPNTAETYETENFAELLDQKQAEHINAPVKKEIPPPAPDTPKPLPHKPHNEPLDKSIERKLKQGKIAPDAVIDLHGLNQTQAHAQLNRTLSNAYNTDKRVVLVITGKGKAQSKAEDWLQKGQGILKQKLPQWVKVAPLKDIVIDAVSCHAKHGGSGAYYVIIKKKK